jgi:hypothetical protein
MEDLGNLVLYILLAIIAIAGSIQSSKKKKASGRAAPPRAKSKQEPEPVRQMQQQPRPQYVPVEPVNEGYFEDPVAASFAGEGSVSQNSAAAFADEGSIEDTMATAFAMEGVSALNDLTKDEFSHIDITDSEINDAPEYDYNADETGVDPVEGFNLRRAVIYSAILNRKEYSF